MAVLGAIFNLLVYYPLRNRTYLPVLISTIGASIFLANSVLALYGPQPQVLPGWFDTPGIQLGSVYLDSQYLLIIAVTIVLVAFQYWLFERTLLGKKLQATSQDKEMAALLGIPVATMIMITFVYSAVLGGIAGILVAPVLFVSIQMGSTIALTGVIGAVAAGDTAPMARLGLLSYSRPRAAVTGVGFGRTSWIDAHGGDGADETGDRGPCGLHLQ